MGEILNILAVFLKTAAQIMILIDDRPAPLTIFRTSITSNRTTPLRALCICNLKQFAELYLKSKLEKWEKL